MLLGCAQLLPYTPILEPTVRMCTLLSSQDEKYHFLEETARRACIDAIQLERKDEKVEKCCQGSSEFERL